MEMYLLFATHRGYPSILRLFDNHGYVLLSVPVQTSTSYVYTSADLSPRDQGHE